MTDPTTATGGTLLVVCHEATRTGAARVVTELLEAAKPKLPASLAVRLLAEGPLAARLETLSDVDPVSTVPAAVLVNSALAADALADIDRRTPVLVYVHEEGAALDALPTVAVEALRAPNVDVLCVSESSRRALVALGIDPDRVDVLRPLVRPIDRPDDSTIDRVRRSLGCPAGHQLVLGCGEAGWRKGADLFVELAARSGRDDTLHFAWVGRRPRGFARQLDHDLTQLGGRVVVHWTGEVDDVSAHLAAADVLVMTSREDPQPLVPLEAAYVGTPTVGYDVSGLRELAHDAAALTVPYPDTAALLDAVTIVCSDPTRAEGLVAAARRRAAQQRPEAVVSKFVSAVGTLLDRSEPTN